MILDIFDENGIEIIVSYLPVWEMFFSMHVLSNPEHHITRKKWTEAKEREFPYLVEKIRGFGELTDTWNLIIDSDKWGEVRQMEIVEMLSFFRKKNIYQWNEWINYSGKQMSIEERDKTLSLAEEYYYTVFEKEEVILRAYLLRVLKEEETRCRQEGLWAWCKKIHPRLIVEKNRIIYMKNREFRFEKNEIEKVYITASTFVSPHLWLYENNHELEIVKGILVEEEETGIPQDLVRIFKTLGDGTRLQIIKHLLQGMATTQALAQKMNISEAAVSKHLKVLLKAGLVRKHKRGHYMEYKFNTEAIDFIPYTFYENMLM